MALTVGRRLGPYEIIAPLGAGGMGEVYRAKDTKLGRDVAIKVLPDLFAADPDRLARFQREAQVLASLNHHNIGGIYGLEELDGVRALVLELVEGPTLADRIAHGPIPIDEALPIARQIAEALEAAHEQGIIHRDLKPANIKLRPDGAVKVLDFGLAKALTPDAAVATVRDLSQSPTITSPAASRMGVIIGTAAYMSPEQARGKAVDKRTDVWSFGCVLYEMLTGKRAFEDEDVSMTLSKVLQREPDFDALPPTVPARMSQALRVCLRKDSKQRVGDIRDVRLALEGAFEVAAPPTVAPAVKPRPFWKRAIPVAAAAVVSSAMVGAAVWTLKPAPLQPVSRLAVPLPPGERLPIVQTSVLALSPDGSQVAFVAARDGRRQVYLRAFDRAESRAIPGTEGAESLFFSPDGKWLGFATSGNLMKVSIDGGVPLTICAAPFPRGVSWGDNETIVFASRFGTSGLSQVSAAGGKPQPITSRDSASEEEAHRWPQLLPGGKAVLFTAWTQDIDDAQIVVQRLDTREQRVILRGGTYARYVPTGQLVYARAGTLMAVRFDLSRLEMIGDSIPVAQGVSLTTEGAAQFDVSRTGLVVYMPGDVQGTGRSLVWVDRTGREQPLEAPPRIYENPRISPDGQQVAVVVVGANADVWVYDIPRHTLSRLTSQSRSISPIWTSDGKRIIYRSARAGTLNLFGKAADGSGQEERLTESRSNHVPTSTSPDGQALVFTEGGDLWILPLTGEGKSPRPFFKSSFSEGPVSAFSPDGRWLAYTSNEGGRNEIYVQPFPAGGRKVQISRDGGAEPRWVRSGELFYRNGVKVMAVELPTQPTLTVGQARMLFEGPQYVAGVSSFDVSPDGQRLLMIKEGEQAASATQINVVLNWQGELKRLVPTNR